MYSWYLGDASAFEQNPEDLLLGVKSLLPRWMNGIPDAQFIDMFRKAKHTVEQIEQGSGNKCVFVETGIGASTIALAGAIAASGSEDIRLFSWDVNGRKQSEIRSVISETLCQFSSFDVTKQLVTITGDAKSEVCGIAVLDELDLEIIFGFFDSMHTHEQLLSEVKLAMSSLGQTSVIYIDDHQLTCSVENVHLGNLARRKLGLSDVPADVCNRFSVKSDFGSAVMELLSEKFMIAKQEWSLTDALTEDLDQTFFSYFAQDRMVMHQVGAELSNSSLNRAISYRLRRK